MARVMPTAAMGADKRLPPVLEEITPLMWDSCSSLYSYKRLTKPNEIRLVKIDKPATTMKSPQSETAFLEIQLSTRYSIINVELEHAPQYEALSYVWGDPGRSHTMRLTDGKILSITTSIANALPYAVQACQTGYLWIDQISIDQDCLEERNQQVKIMGEIYRRSCRCLIWIQGINCYDSESGSGIDWNAETGEELRQFFQSFAQSSNCDASKSRAHLLWLLQYPWFKRTWVYQEFVLSSCPVFLIGNVQLFAHDFEKAFTLAWPRSAAWYDGLIYRLKLDRSQTLMLRRAPGMEFLLTAFESRGYWSSSVSNCARSTFRDYEAITYADMLNCMAGSESQDPRDHVYGFIGLAPFILRHLQVDYSLSIEETFASMMKALVKETGSLDFFGCLPSEADQEGASLRLPSWVPNWTVQTTHSGMLCHDNLFDAVGQGYALPWTGKCNHRDSSFSAWNELEVAGKVIDTVLFVLQPYSVYQTKLSLDVDFNAISANLPWEIPTIDKFGSELHDLGLQDPLEDLRKGLLRALLMDGVQWAAYVALKADTVPLHRTGLHVIGLPHNVKTADLVSALCQPTRPYPDKLPHGATAQVLHELSKVQYRRRIVYCTNGKFGLATDRVKEGDKIAVIHGSRVPVVLRQLPTDEFHVVGQCFYDGAMYGEMAPKNDEDADIFKLV
jgi:hypothetical protein